MFKGSDRQGYRYPLASKNPPPNPFKSKREAPIRRSSTFRGGGQLENEGLFALESRQQRRIGVENILG